MTQYPTIRCAARTHPGTRRPHNEDSYVASFPYFLVADGMGGHGRGEEASAAAVKIFQDSPARPPEVEELQAHIAEASWAVQSMAMKPPYPGTTLSGAVVGTNEEAWEWTVINIGDSRTYATVDGVFSQVSHDHSHVQELIDTGVIHADEAEGRRDKHIITRAFVASSNPRTNEPDYFHIPMYSGQRLLICTDGLSNEVADDELANAIQGEDLQQCCDTLVDTALARGGHDNITVMIVSVDAILPH